MMFVIFVYISGKAKYYLAYMQCIHSVTCWKRKELIHSRSGSIVGVCECMFVERSVEGGVHMFRQDKCSGSSEIVKNMLYD